MTNAILTTKVHPTYDDLPEKHYLLPCKYLRQVEAAADDCFIYYEPRRPSGDLMRAGGQQAYLSTVRIMEIIAGPATPYHFYALIDDCLPFDHAGPFKDVDQYHESGLCKEDGSTKKGAFVRAVRSRQHRSLHSLTRAQPPIRWHFNTPLERFHNSINLC